MSEFVRGLRAAGFVVWRVGEEGKKHIELELKPTVVERGKRLAKHEELFNCRGIDDLMPMLRLLKSVSHQLRKSKDEKMILFWKHRTAEDIIKLAYDTGEIPPQSSFIAGIVRSWIRESHGEYFVDLGRALQEAKTKSKKRRLSKVQTFPYVLMNRSYEALTKAFAVAEQGLHWSVSLRREDRILLAISQVYDLSMNQVRQILFHRAPFDRYVSPFTRLSTKEAKTTEWKIWDSYRRKKKPGMTDREAHMLVATEKDISVETVRRACQTVKAIFGKQRKRIHVESDEELEKLVQAHLNPPEKNPQDSD